MAFKLLEGEAVEPTQEASPLVQEQEPLNESSLLGRLGIQTLRGIESPVDVVNSLLGVLGEPPIKAGEPLSSKVQKLLGYSEEELEPKYPLEGYAHKVAQQAPVASLFGLPSVARTAASAIPAYAAEQAGAPEWLQDIVQVGSDIGLGIMSGRYQSGSAAKKSAYKSAGEAVGKQNRWNAKPVEKGLAEAADRLSTSVNSKEIKSVNTIMDSVKKNIKDIINNPQMDPKKALELRKGIYKEVAKFPDLKNYTKPITQGINDFFTGYGLINPTFFRSLNKGDQLHMASKAGSVFENMFELLPLQYFPQKFSRYGKEIIKNSIGFPERFAKNIVKHPEYAKLVGRNIKAFGTGNAAVIKKNLQHLLDFNKDDFDFAPKRHKNVSKTFELISEG